MAANDVQIQIIGKDLASATFKNVNAAAAGTTAQIAALGRTTSGLNNILTSAAGVTAGIAGFNSLTAAIQGTVGAISNFKKSMEVHETGMAGILLSMTQINGRSLAWGESLALSKNIMAQLNSEALRTAATTEELTGAFRGILGPALNAKMTINEIIQLSSAGVNAVKSIMPNNADVQRQIIQELRDLVAGGIQPASSTLATALGLKDSDIKVAKESSEGLFKFLMDRLKGFETSAPAYARTWQGIQDQIKEGFTLAGSQGTDRLFGALKDEMASIAAQVVVFNQETGKMEVNPALVSTFRDISDTIITAGGEIKALASDISVIAVPAAQLLGSGLKLAAENAQSLTYAIGGWVILRQVNVWLADAKAVAAGAAEAQTWLGKAVADTQVKYAQQAATAVAANAEATAATTAAAANRERAIVNAERMASAAVLKTEKQVMASAVKSAQAAGASAGEIAAIIQRGSVKAALAAEQAGLAARNAMLSIVPAANTAAAAIAGQGTAATMAGQKTVAAAGTAAIAQKELAAAVGLTTVAHAQSGGAAVAAGTKTVGAMAVGKTAVGNMLSAVWALAGGWAGVALGIGYALYKLREYAQEQNDQRMGVVEGYNPDAKIRKVNRVVDNQEYTWFQKEIDETEPVVDHMGNVSYENKWVDVSQEEAVEQFKFQAYQEKLKNNKPWNDGDDEYQRKMKELEQQIRAKYEGVGGDGGKAAKAAERAYEEQQRLQDKIADMTAKMDSKINAETTTAFETSTAKLADEAANMKRELEKSKLDFAKYGIDISGVYQKIGQYQDAMTAKIERQRSQAFAGLVADTAVVVAGISGDPHTSAEADYQKELIRIQVERDNDDLFKKIARSKEDAEARAAADAYYAEMEAAALKARNDEYREADLEKYDMAVEHNSLLVTLEGQSTTAIDGMNKRILDNKIGYLQQELSTAKLNAKERLKLENELANAIENRNQIMSRNMYDAGSVAITDIKNEQYNFANLYKSTWEDINGRVNEHFKAALKGSEGFSDSMKNMIVDVADSIADMFLDMAYQELIYEPLKQQFTQMLAGIQGARTQGGVANVVTAQDLQTLLPTDWLSSANSGLVTAGATLNSAGTGLITANTGLTTATGTLSAAGTGLGMAATALMNAANALAGGSSSSGGSGWWGSLLNFGSSSGGSTSSIANAFTQSEINQLLPTFASGGKYSGGLALVGEKGPELINFDRAGYVHTANETQRLLSSKHQTAAVKLNVYNNTGTQAKVTERNEWDGQQYVISVFLDALERNVGGLRTAIGR